MPQALLSSVAISRLRHPVTPSRVKDTFIRAIMYERRCSYSATRKLHKSICHDDPSASSVWTLIASDIVLVMNILQQGMKRMLSLGIGLGLGYNTRDGLLTRPLIYLKQNRIYCSVDVKE